MTSGVDPKPRGRLFAGPAPEPAPAPAPAREPIPEDPQPEPVTIPDPGPRLDALERRADHAEAGLGRLDLRLHAAEVRLDRLEQRKDEHDPRFADVDLRIAGLQEQLSPFLARVQSGVAGFGNDMRALRDRLVSIEKTLASAGTRDAPTAPALIDPSPPGAVNESGTGRLRLVSGPAGRFLVDPRDAVGGIIAAGEIWQPELRAAIGRVAQPGGVAVDAGAGIGVHSVQMSRHFGEVVALESCRSDFHVLCGNLALNECVNVRALDLRLGAGGTEAITIDSLGLRDVAFIRVGGAGAVPSVLMGAEATIRRFRPAIAFGTAVEGRNHPVTFLADFGYVLETLRAVGVGGDPLFLAVPSRA